VSRAHIRSIVVTRPEEPGRVLTTALIERGADALWLPAFDLAPAPDFSAVRTVLAALSTFDLAIFVSPAAVRATAALLNGPWPAAAVIGAAGQATVDAVRARLRLGSEARIVAPDDDEGGSEALLRALDAASVSARRALILRAASGRDWLGDRLAERGVQVETLAVYDRRAHALTEQERARLMQMGVQPIDSVFSSSEAVAAVQAMMPVAIWEVLQQGTTVASHSRIAQRLTDAGFGKVKIAPLQAEAILAALGIGDTPQ
jgi:uroporphyrinogen-III synthase